MVTLENSGHSIGKCIKQNSINLSVVREEIDRKVGEGKAFGTYIDDLGSISVVSFIPIEDLDNKTVAWLVSYEESEFIAMTLDGGNIIKVVSFFVLLLLTYFIVKQIRATEKLKQEHNLLNEVLSTTEDIIFVTNFKKIEFFNKKFRESLNIGHSSEYNKNVLDMFVVAQ